MTEKTFSQHIRYSYSIGLLRAVITSISVILVISILILMGDLLQFSGSALPLIVFLLMIFIGMNMLGYLELSLSLPSSGGAYRLVQSCEEGSWLAFL